MAHIDESVSLSIDIELGGPWEPVSRPVKPKYPGWLTPCCTFHTFHEKLTISQQRLMLERSEMSSSALSRVSALKAG
jgi:hypothetical protein